MTPDGAAPAPTEVEPNEMQGTESAEATPMQSDNETDEMVERLEDLILEAYSCMQSDGEYIFLPDEVAEKLHRVADEMKMQEKQESGEGEATGEIEAPSGQDSGSGDAAEKVEEENQEVAPDRPEPEHEQENQQLENQQQDKHDKTSEEEKQRGLQKVEKLKAEAVERREEKKKKQSRIPRVHSTENLFTELAPVPELDEEASSGTPSPPLSRGHSGASTPNLKARTPARHFPPPPIIALSSTPSSVAASPDHNRKTPGSITPDHSSEEKHSGRALTYEKRREAALKLKEDKKRRELRIRESARKQREESKRQLEQVHQKEMEEKRERVRRIREERLHRRSGKTAPKSK